MDVIISRSRGARVGCHGIFNFAGKSGGFSLLEIMVILTILSLLFGLGIPSIHKIIATNRASSHINSLVGAFALTRSEAIKRSKRITLCQSPDQIKCETSGDWAKGWLGFSDDNKNRQLDDDEKLLIVGHPLTGNTTINFNGALGIDGYIVYKADGSAYPNGTFTICIKHRPEYGKALILYRTGRLRLGSKTAQKKPVNCS